MTVAELIAELSTLNPEALVVLQKDSEGNVYSPLLGADGNVVYLPESTRSGEVSPAVLMEELIAEGFKPEDILEGNTVVACVVLHPVN